jgi:hypothetical protein
MHTTLSFQQIAAAPCGPPQCCNANDHADHYSPTPTPVSSHLSSIVRRSSSMLTIYLPPPNWLRPCDATTVPTVDRNPRHDRRRLDSILSAFYHLLWPVRLHTHVHTCNTHTCWQSSTLTSSAPRPSICGLVRDPALWSCGSVPTIPLHRRCRDSFPTPPDGLALPPFPCEPQQQ